jgi:hypothetical protein
MLEHLAPAARDEALGGDLLEEFRRGRSEGWYWWQVLSACGLGWLLSLRARIAAGICAPVVDGCAGMECALRPH